MIYKSFGDLKISALGLGTMRLPVIDGDYARIDEERSAEMIALAMEAGINYYDTAWGYHSGQSEPVVGKLLEKYPRDSFYLASKFPGYQVENLERKEEIFESQLERCRVDYFDFYLFHTVSESNIDNYLNEEKYGLCSYLVEQKKKGRIRHLGFSVHAELETTKRFLEAYGEHMEFCQVQLNWIDWDYQDAKAKIELLKEYNIPVWVMEPLRGGKLAALPEECEARLRALRPAETIPAWSFRYLQSIPSVTVTLSGMSNREQLEENIRTFATEEPLNDAEIATLYEIAETMTRSVPCTACRYCVDGCPQSLDIPHLIKKYNEAIFHGKVSKSVLEMEEDALPTSCIGCAACEAACPQKIGIASVMADFADRIRKARA